MTKKILITGGCGFIGHHVVEHFYSNTDWDIIIIDKLSYASKGYDRLRSSNLLGNRRVKIFTTDISYKLSSGLIQEIGEPNYIIHMAADTHIDTSIKDPVPFIKNNVMSTVHILEYARQLAKLEKFFYFSTDEVFGAAPLGISYKENDTHNPTNPYSASKSAAEQICSAYSNTYKLPIIITNVMNAFGERQHTEKYIPKIMKYILEGKTLNIHASKDLKTIGSRFYIHCRNIASVIMFLLKNGKIGEKYHITGEKEIDNLELAQYIAKKMNMPLKYKLINFHEDRPGHDLRYALDGTKLFNLGWKPPVNFDDSLSKTIEWTMRHKEWLLWDL